MDREKQIEMNFCAYKILKWFLGLHFQLLKLIHDFKNLKLWNDSSITKARGKKLLHIFFLSLKGFLSSNSTTFFFFLNLNKTFLLIRNQYWVLIAELSVTTWPIFHRGESENKIVYSRRTSASKGGGGVNAGVPNDLWRVGGGVGRGGGGGMGCRALTPS